MSFVNIFALHRDPYYSARAVADQHLGLMIQSGVNMLSTALRVRGLEAPYGATHRSHLGSIWVRSSADNYDWLVEYMVTLNHEWKRRGVGRNTDGSDHPAVRHLVNFPNGKDFLDDKGLQKFAITMPPRYRHPNSIVSWRRYYRAAKIDPLSSTWTGLDIPNWIRDAKKINENLE